MAKKSKKKSIAYTKKRPPKPVVIVEKPKSKLKKLFKRTPKPLKKSEQNPELSTDEKVEGTQEVLAKKKESKTQKSKKFLKKILKKKSKKEPTEVAKETETTAKKAETQEEKLEEEAAKSKKEAAKKVAAVPFEPEFLGELSEKKRKLFKLNLTAAQKQKLKGGLLSLAGLVLLTFIGIFVLGKVFRPESLADFLPKDNTLGLAEINIDSHSDQVKKFYDLMSKYPVYQSQNIMLLLNFVMPMDYKNDLEPWIGRKVGIVLMKNADQDNGFSPVLFVETKDKTKTLDFLRSKFVVNSEDKIIQTTYSGYSMYSYTFGQNYNLFFLNNYLVIAQNEQQIKELIDEQIKPTTRVKDDSNYRRIADNLPQGSLVFGYINSDKLYETLAASPAFQGRRTKDLLDLQPFLKIFSSEGMTAFADNNKIKIQVFSNINRSALNGSSYITYTDKYQGKLMELADQNPILLMGGHDLNKEIKRMGEIFQSGDKSSSLIFDSILESQKQKYFGKDISLQEDIYPLLKNEYLITAGNSMDKPDFSLFLKLNNKPEDAMHIEKIAQAFIKMSAIFSPKIQEVTLPDGSKGQEIVASTKEITKYDNNYSGTNITSLNLGDLPWSVNYSVVDNTLIISTQVDSLHNILDRKNGTLKTSITTTEYYKSQLAPMIKNVDEIWNFQLSPVESLLGLTDNVILKPYIAPFNSVTMTKNFFDDGVSTIYSIDVL